MNKISKDNLIEFAKLTVAAIYVMLLIITCTAVYNATAGHKPEVFYVVCTSLHFIFDGFILAYTLVKHFKKDSDGHKS